ncbi:CBM35 domain-containing protein [Phytohabitans sp. ZYX-F-186]|uniref:CBM35 domain-containing protein n=1 Tax=Phytohabitans maris TaxID=3071409 RepID=A0ABU0ZHW4_9ACTN|nr:CBM35 domain-containing protein [Phytohabitans sp. ZYX-F-186]MDQ7906612.1 CBM35 domain-containing protein [Phytohabitans sp. ZYX-F-186]
MGEAGNEETRELRALDAPTQHLPALIPAMAPEPPGLQETGLGRRWRWPLVALAAAALASVPIALFATSDGSSTPRGQTPPLRWPPAAAAVSESPSPTPPRTEEPVAPPPPPPPPGGEAAPPRVATSPSPSPTTPAPASYEAEAPGNRLRGRVAAREMAGASGGSVVGWVGRERDNTLTFTGVTVAKDGRYEVTVHYVTGERRTAAIEVNGRFAAMVDFPATGGWDRVGSVRVTLALRAGANTIEFSNRWAWAPDFDRLVLSP